MDISGSERKPKYKPMKSSDSGGYEAGRFTIIWYANCIKIGLN